MSYPAGNVNSSKPLDPSGKEYSGSGYQHGPASFKRPRNEVDRTLESGALIPWNPKTSKSQRFPSINKGTSKIFYKTRLCATHMGGNCSNGEKCTFAHGCEDLHEPPPNWREYVHAKGTWDNDRGTYRGLKFCRNFIAGNECPYGETCNFLHRIPKETEIASTLPMNISAPCTETTGPMFELRNDTSQTKLNTHLTCSDAVLLTREPACLKTKMCTKWESTGQCPYKGNCHYAHGESEIVMPGSPKIPGVTMNSSISKKNIRLPLNSGGPSNEAAAPAKVTEGNKVLNWRLPRKIVGIYGDWPDGYSLPDNN